MSNIDWRLVPTGWRAVPGRGKTPRDLIARAVAWWAAPRRVVLEFDTIEDAREFREAMGIPEPVMEEMENGGGG